MKFFKFILAVTMILSFSTQAYSDTSKVSAADLQLMLKGLEADKIDLANV